MQTNRLAKGNAVHAIVSDSEGAACGYRTVHTACGKVGQAQAHKADREDVTCKRCLAKAAPVQAPQAKRTLTATLPDGGVATRTTARDYRYVLAVREDGGWGAAQWSSRRDLAEGYITWWKNRGAPFTEYRVVPVN